MIHNYPVCVIIGFVIGWIVGWMVRGDENRRYHARRSMADLALDPLPPARVVAWIPRGRAALQPERRAAAIGTPQAGVATSVQRRARRPSVGCCDDTSEEAGRRVAAAGRRPL